ncbi:MAG TPA: phage major capsid protein [Actinomycetota bacterium]|nr:phage major capsid protein [Actinomycetota bacterium]
MGNAGGTVPLLDDLRGQRATARTSADEILTRAAADGRDPAPDELAQYQAHVTAEREAADAMEQERDRQLQEVRAMATRGRSPTLSRASAELARQFRSAIFAKNPQPIEVYADQLADEWPEEVPEPVYGRAGRVRLHTRDTLKTTATQALGTDVYGTIVQHLVETSSLMRAGATVVTTETGEDLVVPRSTGFVTSAITAEGAAITESDPALSTVTLKAFKYSNYFEISQELANDSPTNLLDFRARQAALSLGLGATGYGDDLINGVGTTEPRGLLLDAATGVTAPTGTGTSLGTQGTLNMGTDALWNLVGSVAEPYAESPSAAFIMRNASNVIVRKLRDTTGQPVNGLTDRRSILGYPAFVDPFMPAMANAAESIAFGAMDRYFVRIVNGIRFERSDEFRFQNDLVAFRCILRLDGALIDTNAVKTLVNTT